MLNLYLKPTCPYCKRVLTANESIKADLKLIDITADPANRADLIAKGGKAQVPYLFNLDTNTGLYESKDIIDYLAKIMGVEAVSELEPMPKVCPID